MKAILMLIFATLMIMSLSVDAQDKRVTLGATEYIWDAPVNGAADTLNQADTIYWVQVLANKYAPLFYDVKVKIDEVSGTGKCAISLQGKVFDTDSWANITTVNYAGGGSDTTFTYTQHSTAQFYRYFRVYFDVNSTSTQKLKIEAVRFKFWE